MTWGAIDLDTNDKINKIRRPNKLVINAFIELSESINMTTGIINSFDNHQCKTYIRALHKYGYELNSKEIFSYLVSELHWESSHAKDVIKLIDKVNSGGYFKGGAKIGLKNYINSWK